MGSDLHVLIMHFDGLSTSQPAKMTNSFTLLPPSVETVWLMDLKASLDRWRQLEPDADEATRATMAQLVQAQAASVELAEAEPAWESAHYEVRMMKLKAELLELEYTLIPHGLHALGKQMTEQQRIEMHLQARQAVRVQWPGGERLFAPGETIHTENACKWSVPGFEALLLSAGFAQTRVWTDPAARFAVLWATA